MKKYNLILLVLLCTGFYACEHDKLDLYDSKDNIYFTDTESASSIIPDSTIIRFGYDFAPKSDSTIAVKVKVMGKAVNYERSVNYTIVTDSSTAVVGTDIEILSGTIPADSVNGFVYVKLNNRDILKDETRYARLQLVPNNEFDTNYNKRNCINYRVFFDAKSGMPNLWADYTLNFERELGKYSKAKLQLICETVGVDISYFEYDPTTETPKEVYDERFSVVLKAWAKRCRRALSDYKEKYGKDMVDENGEVIKFGNNDFE